MYRWQKNPWQAVYGSGVISMGLGSALSWILNKTDDVSNGMLAKRIGLHAVKCFGAIMFMGQIQMFAATNRN